MTDRAHGDRAVSAGRRRQSAPQAIAGSLGGVELLDGVLGDRVGNDGCGRSVHAADYVCVLLEREGW